MKRGKEIHANQANTLYEALDDDGNVLPYIIEMERTDCISADDVASKDLTESKGYIFNLVSNLFFKRFAMRGVFTHFVSEGTTPFSKFVRKADMIPLKVVGRNYAAGSFCRRYGVKEGELLGPVLVELFYKNDELGNPLIDCDAALTLDLIDDVDDLEIIFEYMKIINEAAEEFFDELGILRLVDFKAEFGYDKATRKVMLCDGFGGPDTYRLMDIYGNSVESNIFHTDVKPYAVNMEAYQRFCVMLEAMSRGVLL